MIRFADSGEGSEKGAHSILQRVWGGRTFVGTGGEWGEGGRRVCGCDRREEAI